MIVRSRCGWPLLVAALVVGLASAGGCKQEGPTCEPKSVTWGLQLALQASDRVNPTDEGESLPTVVRVFQLRGDIAIEDLEFDALWKAEKAEELGESFLTMEELTLFPSQAELRKLPVEAEATHVLAAGFFRKPASDTWYTTYELPTNHGDIVCAKAPTTKQYPEPCFFARLDRNGIEGGATPPAGFEQDESLQCAPLGVVLQPTEQDERSKRKERRKKRRQERRGEGVPEADDLQKQLDGAADKIPETPETPDTPTMPKTPQLPKTPELPKTPNLPDAPKAPTTPKAPTAPRVPGKPR